MLTNFSNFPSSDSANVLPERARSSRHSLWRGLSQLQTCSTRALSHRRPWGIVSAVASCVVALLAVQSALAASVAQPDKRIGPPATHRNLGNVGASTTSWIERAAVWSNAGSVEFEAFVDSQDGADQLEIWLDGVLQRSWSGFHQGGRASVPVAWGADTVRFAYTKDASIDVGLDTAWIDKVRFVSGTAMFETHSFAGAEGCNIDGWTRGGHSGGWCTTLGPEAREWRRPDAMAYAGYQPAPVSHGLARDVTFPTTTDQNEIAVRYAVDCEPDNDFFRIQVDGEERFRVSGRQKIGFARVPIKGGTHRVVLEYVKDESVDEGFDEARIGAIEFRSLGKRIGYGGVDGSTLGELPRGWTAVSSGTGTAMHWNVVNASASPIQIVSDSRTRVADGYLSIEEYQAKVRIDEPSVGLRSKFMIASSMTEHLMFGIELPAPFGDWFLADGSIEILVDSSGPSAPMRLDCGPDNTRPGPASRKIVLAPAASGGTTVTEEVGTCGDPSGHWRPASTGEQWPVSSEVVPGTEPGSVYVEVEIGVNAPVGLAPRSPVGFGIVARSTMAPTTDSVFLRYPNVGHHQLDESDSSTWRHIHRWGPLTNP